VNGKQIRQAPVQSRDLVLAGRTTFRIHLPELVTPTRPLATDIGNGHEPIPVTTALRLTLTEGVAAGKSCTLFGEPFLIGRSGENDLPIEDLSLSKSHLEIRRVGTIWYVKDTNSRNGTLRNGQPITQSELNNGDVLTAGGCKFAVELMPVEQTDQPEPLVVGQTVPNHDEIQIQGRFTISSVADGLISYASAGPQHPIAEFVLSLAKQWHLTLLADPIALGWSPKDHPAGSVPLWDWLDENKARAVSPMVIPGREIESALAIIRGARLQDGWVAYFSSLPADTLLAHLRSVSREEAPMSAPLSLSRPSLVGSLFDRETTDRAKQLMKGISAILLERDEPESWRIISNRQFHPTLDNLGLKAVGPTTQEIKRSEFPAPLAEN
jgi:pSer/pThr/pTyr-binding forkhead associated (FHA) protein